MEEVTYRRSPIMVKTIPKGTLLFRLTKSTKDDLRGLPKKDGTRCILSNHNVFFYPNPFVGKLALGEFRNIKNIDMMSVYVLKNDIRVVWLLKPSKYAKTQKNAKRSFLKKCSKTRKGCLDRTKVEGSHAPYNPCFSEGFIEKNPDIVGMMYVSVDDGKRTKAALKDKTSIKKYFKFATDSNEYSAVPELVLHPLKKRPSKDVIVHSGDPLETNYKLLTQFETVDNKLMNFMEKHAEYNPETFYYTYKE